MSASAELKYTQKLTGGVGAVRLRFSLPTTASRQIMIFDPDGE